MNLSYGDKSAPESAHRSQLSGHLLQWARKSTCQNNEIQRSKLILPPLIFPPDFKNEVLLTWKPLVIEIRWRNSDRALKWHDPILALILACSALYLSYRSTLSWSKHGKVLIHHEITNINSRKLPAIRVSIRGFWAWDCLNNGWLSY